jgi:hypothetical protein
MVSKEIHCFDLKSATDRFPLVLQKHILKTLTNNSEYSENWASLIADRQFKYKTKFYKWSVGQPLGAYSSWPIFAYSHHLVVRTAARLANVKEPEYYLLGDDIVINGNAVAQEYKQLLAKLGVDISLTKSISGCHAEFAKRLFTQGLEISPVPVKLLATLARDPLLIKEACEQLCERSSNAKAFQNLRCVALRSFAFSFSKQKAKEVLIVGSSLSPGTVPPVLHGVSSVWPRCRDENLETVYSYIKYKYLIDNFKESAYNIDKMSTEIRALELPNTPREATTLHPIWTAVERQKSFFAKAHKGIGKYWTELRSKTYLPKQSLPSVESFNLDSLTKSHRSRTKHKANILLLTHKTLVKAEQVFKERLEHEVIVPNDLLKAVKDTDERTSSVTSFLVLTLMSNGFGVG